MAITYAYPTATPETQDLLVGTEMAIQGGEGTPRTRTFTVGSIVDLAVTSFINSGSSLYAPKLNPVFSGTVTGVTKAMVGLANADNTTDLLKPISTATQTALNLKANIESPTFTGTVGGITKAMVGLSNVDNTTDLLKPVSTATQTALNLKANIASPTFTGVVTSPSFVKSGGSSTQYLMADGNTTTMPTLQQVTTAGAITFNPIIVSTSVIAITANGVIGVLAEADETAIIGNGYFYGVQGTSVVFDDNGNGAAIEGKVTGSLTSIAGRFKPNKVSDGVVIEHDTTGSGVYGMPFKVKVDNVTKATIDTNGDVTAKSFIKTGGTSLQYLMANGDTSTFTQDIQSVLDNGGFAENVNVNLQSEGGTTLTLSGTDSNGTLAANAGGGEEGVAVVANGQGGIAIKAIGGTDGIGVRVTSGGISIVGATGAAAPYQLSLSLNSAVKPSTNTWTIASDNRVKTNINPYTKGLETILAINPVTYDYNGKAGFDPTITGNIGVIAQDVLNIIPESIDTYYAKLNEEDEEKTELYNFDSHALTFILINAIKQLSAEIELLKSK